jgi:hypothetical protein
VLDRFGKVRNRLIRVAVLNPLADTVVQVAFQDDLPDLMQCALCGIDLDKDILAGDIFVHHFINSLDLAYDLA